MKAIRILALYLLSSCFLLDGCNNSGAIRKISDANDVIVFDASSGSVQVSLIRSGSTIPLEIVPGLEIPEGWMVKHLAPGLIRLTMPDAEFNVSRNGKGWSVLPVGVYPSGNGLKIAKLEAHGANTKVLVGDSERPFIDMRVDNETVIPGVSMESLRVRWMSPAEVQISDSSGKVLATIRVPRG